MPAVSLYVVIPCYNEQEVLPETSRRLADKFSQLSKEGKISGRSRILFVDDGSRDGTWELIERLHGENPIFCGLKLSRNRGHQNALLAGLMHAKDRAGAAASMDADLQDDVNILDQFLEEYEKGCDIVYGVRTSRKTDSFFKRNSALGFYRFMRHMGVELVENHADCRLMSRRALQGLAEFPEANLFLRGLVPLIGYRSTAVGYERSERFAGTSKYPLKKMLAFAFDGITSLSVKPIRVISALGFFVFLMSILMLIYTVIRKWMGATVAGWAFLSCSIWMLGGVQLLSLGILGEYIGKIYAEVKRRPRYLIEKLLDEEGGAPMDGGEK